MNNKPVPASIKRQIHKGLVKIPFPDLPRPAKRRQILTPLAANKPPMALPLPKPTPKQSINNQFTDLHISEADAGDYPSQISNEMTQDESKTKDHGDHISTGLDSDDYL